MKNLWNWIVNVFKQVKKIYVRSGLDKFLSKYILVAVDVIDELANVHSNASFHEWKDEAFKILRTKIVDDVKDNWISLLIGFAYENWKARKPQSIRTELK